MAQVPKFICLLILINFLLIEFIFILDINFQLLLILILGTNNILYFYSILIYCTVII